MHSMDKLDPMPPDALLGLMAEFRKDPRTEKTDLGVGMYTDEDGRTPIMAVVKQAEIKLLESATTKAYEGPRGNVGFCEQVESLTLGDARETLADRMTSLATPGGCGAIYLAINLAARLNPESAVWVSDPSWPNHAKLALGSGRRTCLYPYLTATNGEVDIEAILDSLSNANPGDLVIVQGPCHNPTGLDFGADSWRQLCQFITENRLLILIDIAYHGFGDDLVSDLSAIRQCLPDLSEAFISYSCSKNFGLYRERAGCLIALTPGRQAANAMLSHLADISRASYSMPPAHGQAVVDIILSDENLTRTWQAELGEMRHRINRLRAEFLGVMDKASGSDIASIHHRGMFLQLDLSQQAIASLRDNCGIYIPNSGRINIAGLTSSSAHSIGTLIAKSLND